MKMAISAALAAGLPLVCQAQQTVVPAIVRAETTPAAHLTVAVPLHGNGSMPAAKVATVATENSAPPAVNLLSPSAPLNAKERRAVALARRWKNRPEMPQRGDDGVVRFLYGATLPTVVCAPLQVCDLALEPGEIVNSVNVGDKVRWLVSPAVSGERQGQVTHLIIKPTDAGLMSSLVIETNRRTYAIKLVSTRHEWMPLIAFNYPSDAQRQWSLYRQTVAFGAAAATLPSGENIANLDFGFRLSGDHPDWRPLRVYTDGSKTYIEFPRSIGSDAAPALVALDNDGGWFSSPTERMVNYRMEGDRYIVDRVLDRAELVSGVGSDQTRVVITRDGAR
jgi:type IV secretion system protein TrbG